ncbi:ATP-grasp domain-containing protein [Aquimarina agarivorans]|uniref:ATP-grasp domain-containing protein n=1 Tax=Aquimarina agarivorans TaxID=980584 RepID=UPI000248E878|nr:ATP-grasp domain-containing protein [Aquimarina agarivorans]
MKKVAVLYQYKVTPIKNGIQKPMKPGGYSDSGADIAVELHKSGVSIITPFDKPDLNNDLDWVFPDTKQGIQLAIDKGANVLWLNTILYNEHPIIHFFNSSIKFVGQSPNLVDTYDDKWITNQLLTANDISIPKTQFISKKEVTNFKLTIDFPLVLKPLRGRGSQGVSVVQNKENLDFKLTELFSTNLYGDSAYVEQFLSGQEITVTVMPPGNYKINSKNQAFVKPWSLPAVKRVNHQNGIAPYNGVVAVIENSKVLNQDELNAKNIIEACKQCEKAAMLLQIKAPIRIDCRADKKGNYFLFDLNLKPNMTGPSRLHRQDQDSLTLLAARAIGWNYFDLLNNMLLQQW